MPERIRVLLVDGPTLPRRSLAALLSRRRGLRVVGEAGDGVTALASAVTLGPDVAVVDPSVPDGGAQLVASLSRTVRAVLVLTLGGGEGAASRALHAGARGYVQKTCEPDELVRTIERIHQGELVVAAVPAALLKGLGHDRGPSRLTDRELEVLRLVPTGQTNQEIARWLGITEHTAKEHLANILAKLGLDNRVQAAMYAVAHGLVTTPATT